MGVFNEMAVISVWHDEFNNEVEETFNEEEDNGENLAEEEAIYIYNRINNQSNNLTKTSLTQ